MWVETYHCKNIHCCPTQKSYLKYGKSVIYSPSCFPDLIGNSTFSYNNKPVADTLAMYFLSHISVCVLQVVYVALCIAITLFCWISAEHTPECTAALQGIDSKTLVLLGKVALWVMVFIYDRFVQRQHSAVRRRGYLDFYRLTRGIKNLPLLIHSAGEEIFHTMLMSHFPLCFFATS